MPAQNVDDRRPSLVYSWQALLLWRESFGNGWHGWRRKRRPRHDPNPEKPRRWSYMSIVSHMGGLFIPPTRTPTDHPLAACTLPLTTTAPSRLMTRSSSGEQAGVFQG